MPDPTYQQVIDYLNAQAERNFKLTPKHSGFIKARINEGYVLADFKKVVDNMVREWQDDPKMYKFLRPETLFGNKFDGYLNTPAPPAPIAEKSTFQKKRDVVDQWLQESEDNDKKRLPLGDQNINELRGAEAGHRDTGSLVPYAPERPTR